MSRAWMIAVAGAAAEVAIAQPFEGFGYVRFEVATAQQGPWSSHLEVMPGTRVFVRQLNGWVSPAPVLGWGVTVLNEIRFDGTNATDQMQISEAPQYSTPWYAPDLSGPYSLWKKQVTASDWAIYDAPTGRTLDNVLNPGTTGRLVTSQSQFWWHPNPPPQAFDTANPTASMYFRFGAGSADAGPRTIRITAEWFRSGTPASNFFLVLVNAAGASTRFESDAMLEEATVTIVPGPGGAAVLLGLLAFRRRPGPRPLP